MARMLAGVNAARRSERGPVRFFNPLKRLREPFPPPHAKYRDICFAMLLFYARKGVSLCLRLRGFPAGRNTAEGILQAAQRACRGGPAEPDQGFSCDAYRHRDPMGEIA